MTTLVPRWSGIAAVLALHGAALWGLWQHRLLPTPAALETLFVHFIAPPDSAPRPEARRPPPRPPAELKPEPQQLVAAMPAATPQDHVAPPPRQLPAIETPAMALPAGPVALGAELSVACPERVAPVYPSASRRRGEAGSVVLRVELDEQGVVADARIETASGYERLDHAALAAVRTWRCNPPRRNGEPVRAIARQPFHFVLQGS